MRPPGEKLSSLLRYILALSFLVGACGVVSAQTPPQLPHAWNEAVYALAEKVAVALGSSRTFSLDVNDVSSAAPVDLAGIRQAFESDAAQRGMRSVSASADAQVQVTVSQTSAGFLLVAEVRRADAQQVAVVPVAAEENAPSQPTPEPGLQRKIVWQQAAPILDFAQVSADSGRALWYFLEPDRLVAYEFGDGAQVLREAQPISRRYSSRDLRGRLEATDATRVTAFVGGVRCDGSWNPSLSVECRENSGQQWPMGSVSWTYVPSRNYFSGGVTLSNSLQAKFPSFFSSASPSAETTGQGASRRVVAGLDGRAQLFDGTAEPVSSFDGWGSDIVSIATGCGSDWQVLVTGDGDWSQKDQIQLYEIKDAKAAAAGQPLELPGPILALWPADDAASVRVISRSLESGLYEASIVSVSCGN
jgi:hypothetical protein